MFIQIHTGVEKHNDDAKYAYLSSNKWDATGDLIKTEARIECLRKYAVAKGKELAPVIIFPRAAVCGEDKFDLISAEEKENAEPGKDNWYNWGPTLLHQYNVVCDGLS